MTAQPNTDRMFADEPSGAPAELLDDLTEFVGRYCVFPHAHEAGVVALWAAWTHMAEHFHAGPRLALLSPEAGSGKTRVLEVLELVVLTPFFAVAPSPAALFRTVDTTATTLLLDETDTIFTRAGKNDDNADLRGLLNVGYKRGATVPRCEGPQHQVRKFSAYAPAALAGLGDLPPTIMTRSIIVRMRRRARTEPVEPFRSRSQQPEGHELRDRLAAWASGAGEQAGQAWPTLPEGVTDRPAELWEPLLAVADAAGGHWPDTARHACEAALKATGDTERLSLGLQLLADLRQVFGDDLALTTEEVLLRLHGLPESPWADLRGRPLDARGLAWRLRAYQVSSTGLSVGERRPKGYRREDLWDAWERYLPPPDKEDEADAQPAPGSRTSAPSAPDAPAPGVTSGNARAAPGAANAQGADGAAPDPTAAPSRSPVTCDVAEGAEGAATRDPDAGVAGLLAEKRRREHTLPLDGSDQ